MPSPPRWPCFGRKVCRCAPRRAGRQPLRQSRSHAWVRRRRSRHGRRSRRSRRIDKVVDQYSLRPAQSRIAAGPPVIISNGAATPGKNDVATMEPQANGVFVTEFAVTTGFHLAVSARVSIDRLLVGDKLPARTTTDRRRSKRVENSHPFGVQRFGELRQAGAEPTHSWF